MNVQIVKAAVTTAIGKSSFILQKYAPEILLATGITGGIGAAVLACRATYRVDEIKAELNGHLRDFNEARGSRPDVYSEEDLKKDTATAYAEMIINLAKLYGPAIGLGIVSVALILASHGIMSSRQAAIVAAYKLMDEAYSKYRNRVIEKYGVEEEEKLRFGIEEPKKKGKKDLELVTHNKIDPMELSPYARWFDRDSCQFQNDGLSNEHFLHLQKTFFNQRLQGYGHVFLNEVYDALGLPRSKEGAVVGWVKNSVGGDNVINFTMYAPSLTEEEVSKGQHAKRILLDFNVDGIIWDRI